jgi:phosphoesterase RecJ-like protein
MTDAYQRALAEVAGVLRTADRIVTVGHIGPDGDALGSALGLAMAARAAGKDAAATFGEPFVVPDEFRFLDLEALVRPGDITGPIDVLVACDTAAPERLGSAGVLAERADKVVVVDHHLSNGGFGDVLLVDPKAAATAQMVFRLIERLEWPIDAATATALYTGVVTDTGRFQYSSTSPETHHVAARLLELGVAPEVAGQHLYEEAKFGYLKVAAAVLGRAVLDSGNRLVWSVMTADDLTVAGVSYQDTDGLIDILRIAEESDVACLFKQVDEGVWKGSLRSRGRVDVAAIAATFGGGGHHNAAGFTHRGTPDGAIERIRDAMP